LSSSDRSLTVLIVTIQRISANAIAALKDALTAAFWFKRDLYNYAKAAVGGEPTFLSGIDWTSPEQYKRDSVNLFVDRLVREQDVHQELLLALPSLRRLISAEWRGWAKRDRVPN
jgi:hypothetical protein